MKTINVAAAIIRDENKILSCQRGYGEFKDGWEFPGGKLESGETGEQAIVREIKEELEVTIGSLEYLCTVEHDYETFHLSMQCYLAEIESGEFREHAHEDMRWLNIEEIWDVDWLPADVKVVEELLKKTGVR